MGHIYYSDSNRNSTMEPEMAQRLMTKLSHPNYRRKNLIPAMLDSAHLPYEMRKSFPANTIVGMNGLTYAVCEQMEYSYGIFSGFTDDEYLLTWLGPMMFFQKERLVFKIFNWTDYLKNVGQRGSSASFTCTVGTYSDVPVQGCELNYCFEPDRHSKFGVPAGLRPSDVVEPCITQPTINVLGTMITNQQQLREFALMYGTRLSILDNLFTGNYCASTVGNNGQEDGILSWFDNFSLRHQYLSETCMTNLAPSIYHTPTTAAALGAALGVTVTDTPAAIAQAKVEYAVATITQHILDVEWKLKDVGDAEISFEQVGVLMHPADAQCIVWYQFCQTKCSGTVIQANNFQEIQAFYAEFQTRLHAGLYGGGVMRLRDGREISIQPYRRMPRGTVVVLVKGWNGGVAPNPYAFRAAAMQYNDWLSMVTANSPLSAMRYRLVMNGTMIRLDATDACTDIEHRWNMRIFSNAPWAQMKLDGLPACAEVSIATWPAFPALTSYSKCVPYGCELGPT